MPRRFEIYYDGDCPLCSAYIQMLNLQQAVGPVELIDARSGDPRLKTLKAAGFDSNEGLVVRHGTQLLHGAEAMQLLALLFQRRGMLRGMLRAIMWPPRRARMVYPLLKAGRRLTLAFLDRRMLR